MLSAFSCSNLILNVIFLEFYKDLLEKGRVVVQEQGDRNFHIFYQLLKSDDARSYGLVADPRAYKYLTQGGVVEVEGMDDWQNFWESKVRGGTRDSYDFMHGF